MEIKTFFDFCSGIGGGRLGLEQCGLKCIGYSDTSRLAVESYNLLHETTSEKNYGNIRKIKTDQLPNFDILIAGFPCQTFSVIGRKEGFKDPRGQLIYYLAKIINDKRPKFFILENVKGLVTHNKGITIKEILDLLSSCGYEVIYKVLSSIDYGVPQMRQRVYFVGFQKNAGLLLSNFKWPEKSKTPPLEHYLIDDKELREEYKDSFARYLKNDTNKGVHSIDDFLNDEFIVLDTRMSDLRIYRGRVPTLRSQRDGIIYVRNGKLMDLTGYEALLLQGFPIEYANKVKNKVSNRHLLMQAGNAMTVNVIQQIGEAILKFANTNIERGEQIMVNWKKYEEECAIYLGLKYPAGTFETTGGSNANANDIKAKVKQKTFSIEAKEPNSQCGQFVLFPDEKTRTFIFSADNKSNINKALPIIEYMNKYYNAFTNPDTSGVEINMQKEVFYDWIIDYYKNTKKVKYFITGELENHIIFPVDSFPTYFNVKAVYRVKKSGSRNIAKSRLNEIESALLSIKSVHRCYFENDKSYAIADDCMAKTQYKIGKNVVYFSPTTSGKFVLKFLSTTANANVIFSIKLKSHQKNEDLNLFLKEFR